MKNLSYIIIIFLTCNLHAQDTNTASYYPVPEEVLEEKVTGIALKPDNFFLPKEDLFGLWGNGEIILNSGEIIKNLIIRYDGVNNQLIISGNGKYAAEKNTIKGFNIMSVYSKEMLHFRKMLVKDKYSLSEKEVFLQILYEGKNSLYVWRRLVRAINNNDVYLKYLYFVRKEDGSFQQFSLLTKHNLFQIFPENKDNLRKGLRKSHNRVKTESDLIKAFDLINSLSVVK